MKKWMVFLAVLSVYGNSWCAEANWEELSRGVVNVKTVVISPESQKVVYLGSDKGLFRSMDGGDNWNNILSIRSGNHTVNYIVFDKKVLYAATGGGLYVSADSGRRWERLFQGQNFAERNCTAVAVLPYAILLGTDAGLFKSDDAGRSWQREKGKLGENQVFNIACASGDPGKVYISSKAGAFKTEDSGLTWERIYVAHTQGTGIDYEEEVEPGKEEDFYSGVNYLALDPNNSGIAYLATNRGVFKSSSSGVSWEPFTDEGLLSRNVQSLVLSDKSRLFANTKSGIFAYQGGRWVEISSGLPSNVINFLGFDKEANLYACTDRGLFRRQLNFKLFSLADNIVQEYTKGEPGIEKVREAAIKYAEVSPDKIAIWRRQAGAKALLPEVNLGLDRNTTDLWHWEGGSTTRADDDVLRRGRDSLDWGVTLSWDLGKLIWNDDQTSIDTRSRLTVQLRNDILDEVVKLYFERIRVKMDMDSLQIEDRRKRFEKELRVQELTAEIDSLTGGYFSKEIELLNRC